MKISQISALIAENLGVHGKGQAIAREVARVFSIKVTAPAEANHAIALLLAHLSPLNPRAAVANAFETTAFEVFGAFRFTVDHGASRGESEVIPTAIYPATAYDALAVLVEAERRAMHGLSRPYSIEAGTRYGVRFMHLTMQQIIPDSEGRTLQVEVIYAPRGQTAVAQYQVPSLGRWSMSACGGDIIANIAKALGPISATGGSGLPKPVSEDVPELESDERPLAARKKAKRVPQSGTIEGRV
jgi:hypothetical protein